MVSFWFCDKNCASAIFVARSVMSIPVPPPIEVASAEPSEAESVAVVVVVEDVEEVVVTMECRTAAARR